MSNIIAGRFEQQSLAEQAREEILRAGFSENQVCTFYVNPPGQHDLTPIGGDRDESPGAEHSERGLFKGGTTGAAVGAAIGAATIPIFGPAGPIAGALVGAHVGDTAGSFSEMADNGNRTDSPETLPFRRAGMMVAVTIDSDEDERRAVDVLRQLHAQDIELAEGTIANGDWEDFDPLQPPTLVEHARRH